MENNTQKLKILIPIISFGKSGGFRVLSELAKNWVANGHEVSFVTYYESHKPYYPTTGEIIWINKKGLKEKCKSKFNQSIGLISRLYCLFRYIKRYSKEYDIILANANPTTLPVLFGSKTNNFYYIQAYEPEFYSVKSIKGLLLKATAWLSYLLPLQRIVNAEIYMKYKNIRSKYVIPPGLDLEVYYPKDLSKKNGQDLIVGCIGRKEEWKGSEDVAKAVKILKDKSFNVKFKVAFNPVNFSQHELIVPDGDNNLAEYYRSLDVLVAPGHIQLGAIHYPVIEAMACNVPVITTGYFPANNKNSFIVPVKRPDEIADTLEMLIGNYTLAQERSKVAQQEIKEFDWKIVSEKFIRIFKEVV